MDSDLKIERMELLLSILSYKKGVNEINIHGTIPQQPYDHKEFEIILNNE